MRTLLVLSLMTVVCLASPYMSEDASAGPAMDPIYGNGSSQLVVDQPPPPSVMMQFRGSVEMLVRGEPKVADLLVNIYGVVVNEEGVQHVLASHTLTFEDGSTITTIDMEVAEPTDVPGLYVINATMDVCLGTGVYEGVSGRLTAHGTIDFMAAPLPAASFTVRGAISTPASD